MTPAERKALCKRIDTAYHEALSSVGAGGDLADARAIAAKHERNFRRVRAGRARALATIETCARLFALRAFVAPDDERSFHSSADQIAGYVAAFRAQRRRPEKYEPFRAANAWILDVNYADLSGGA